MSSKADRLWLLGAALLLLLGLLRLGEGFGKPALGRWLESATAEAGRLAAGQDSLSALRRGLSLEERFLERRIAALASRDPYLVIDRSARRLELAIGDKTVLVTKYELGGPEQLRSALAALPEATLEVLAVSPATEWYRPDRLYEENGLTPPADSAQRLVHNAFGPGEVFLGGDIVIHGRPRQAVAPEAIDHAFIQLDDGPLRSVVSLLKKGSTVLIH
jgi:hypothetical protein